MPGSTPTPARPFCGHERASGWGKRLRRREMGMTRFPEFSIVLAILSWLRLRLPPNEELGLL